MRRKEESENERKKEVVMVEVVMVVVAKPQPLRRNSKRATKVYETEARWWGGRCLLSGTWPASEGYGHRAGWGRGVMGWLRRASESPEFPKAIFH
ncbi:hypothetical protein E2C01_095403 [Portunus trituberculatus]|uniref:Uncharacterized protein n=1 Tax=Portunus trituberculatus TaxID=210409 RepID=A0A5B7K036_PORTR|nr:hypothetical protein [Portunus trituberculatus]